MAAPSRAWAADLLHVWFHELRPAQRFASDAYVDEMLRRRFERIWRSLRGQPAEQFLDDPLSALAAVLLFDQVPRNIHRKSPRAFASDPLARAIAKGAIARGWLARLRPEERQFLAMPLMHSEAIADQRLALRIYAPLGQRYGFPFARAHHKMIARFGRFPHRNAVLDRRSSPAERRAIAAGFAW